MNINLLPDEEKPRERAFTMGIGSLSDEELLTLIIRTGDGTISAQELAGKVMDEIGGGIRGISQATVQELKAIKGIGDSKACAVCSAFELGRRVASKIPKKKTQVYRPQDVADIFMSELRNEKKEHFCILMLDSKAGVLGIERISIGELAGAPVHPREVFAPAIRRSSASVIFVHNHPSGDPTPSSADLETTEKLCAIGKMLGISVRDHLVIGDGEYISLREMGYID